MMPLDAIGFTCGAFEEGPCFLKAKGDGALAVVCRFAEGQSGLLWLTGPRAGEAATMDSAAGCFISARYIEVDLESAVPDGREIPAGALLKSADTLALKYSDSDGGAAVYPIAGTGRFDDKAFAAFANWRASATDRADEKPIYAFNSST